MLVSSHLLDDILRARRYYARHVTSFAERVVCSAARILFRRRLDIVSTSNGRTDALRIHALLRQGGFSSSIVDPDSYRVRFRRPPLLIHSREMRRIPKRYFLLQTRDLSDRSALDPGYAAVLKASVAVLDYSTSNIEHLLATGMNYKKIFYVPHGGDGWRFLARFLLAIDQITYSQFCKKTVEPSSLGKNQNICLSLPETVERRLAFSNPGGKFAFFDGLRHRYAWVGCGMSYKYLCQRAMACGLDYLIVVEDDALFSGGFIDNLNVILSYLAATPYPWHVFSGFIAHLGAKTKVSRVDSYGGFDFVHINKLTSMVFNVYHKSVFGRISRWNEKNYHFYTNTIDRFLENWKELKVVTTIPFLVGHKEELTSSIWNFENSKYNVMVEESIKRLSGLVHAFRMGE